MPYIPKDARERMLLKRVAEVRAEDVGELNYLLTYLVTEYLPKDAHYEDYNEVIGVLEAVKHEMYRRIIAPYEDYKKELNGDVFA